jgi:beta-glucanase (GH16 family)
VYSSLPETLGKAEASRAQLLLDDDFEGNEIDFTKWKYAPEWTRNDYCYWSNEMSVLDGEGHLATKMEWDSERNSLKSGALWSASDYGYGYYEASIKFPKAYGTWGAFWMMCGDVWKESAADGVEIDIVESINNETGAYNHALHCNYASLNSLGPTKLFQADIYNGEFHTFGVLRAENGYFFYVDGKLSGLVPHYQYTPCPIPGRMELTVEAAEWAGAGKPECLEQLPAQMLTDYVRVWDSMPELNP